MKKTQPIKERLNEHRDMLTKLKALETELAFTEAQYGSTQSPNLSGMPSGGGHVSNPVAEMVARKIELEEKVQKQRAKIEEDWAELEKCIEELKPVETLVINLRYYYGGEWDEICFSLFGRRKDYMEEIDRYMNRTFKIHGRALLTLSEIHPEICNNSAGTPTEVGKNVTERQEKELKRRKSRC